MSQLFSKLAHLKGALEHLIVIGLIGSGSFLATTMVPDETALQYSLATHQVSGVSVAHIQLNNTTKRAIAVEVQHPAAVKVLRFVTSIPGVTTAAPRADSWGALLLPQQAVSILMVVDGDFPDSLASKIVQAKFKVVEESTAVVTDRPADLREASVLSVSRSVRFVAWFSAPFILGGIAFIAWVWYRSRPTAQGKPPSGMSASTSQEVAAANAEEAAKRGVDGA